MSGSLAHDRATRHRLDLCTGMEGQDIPGGGDGGWPYRPGHGLWLVWQVADQMSVWRGPGGPVVTAAFALPAAGVQSALAGGAGG